MPTMHCSFCGKSQHAVAKLIAGPKVYICDECVEVCITILASDKSWREKQLAEIGRLHAGAALPEAPPPPAERCSIRPSPPPIATPIPIAR